MKVIPLILFFIIFLLLGNDITDSYVWAGLLFLFLDFINKLGRQFVFLELISLIGWTQYLVGPVLSKMFNVKMYIGYEEYFAYAIPAVSFFIIGMYFPVRQYIFSQKMTLLIRESTNKSFATKGNKGRILVLLGIPFWLAQPYVPPSISYIFFLFSFLLLVGLCMLTFSNKINDLLFIVLGVLAMVSNTLLEGMVGTTIFWFIILVIYKSIYRPFRVNFIFKMCIVLFGLYLLMVIQSAKMEYRAQTWIINMDEDGKIGNRKIKTDSKLLIDLISERFVEPKKIFKSSNVIDAVARLNQGYLVTMAMKHVPEKQNYGCGAITIYATLTSFLPRILYPNKPPIGTSVYFKKYTGIKLSKFHSATLGNLGDAYVDYGRYGSIYLLFLGFTLSLLFKYFILKYDTDPTIIFWFSIIFFYSITVNEVSIPAYLNALLKSLIFIFTLRPILRKFQLS